MCWTINRKQRKMINFLETQQNFFHNYFSQCLFSLSTSVVTGTENEKFNIVPHSDLGGIITRLLNSFPFMLYCMAKIQGHKHEFLPTATKFNPKTHFVIQGFRLRLHSNFTINETILYNLVDFFIHFDGFLRILCKYELIHPVSWMKTMIYSLPIFEKLLISEKTQKENFISQEVNNSR